ncbi:MAG: hypothetical protein K0R78_3435 [Pelosinus sp.]|nr:hypothetical protein [Pelosinus sp.]
MNLFGMFSNEKSRKLSLIQTNEKPESYNYEISSDISSPTEPEKNKQNTLKTEYDLNEDMIFPS